MRGTSDEARSARRGPIRPDAGNQLRLVLNGMDHLPLGLWDGVMGVKARELSPCFSHSYVSFRQLLPQPS
jgi:hypothetical protein